MGGVRPGVTADVENEENWSFQDRELTALEKRIVVATVVKIGILEMMNTHMYSFNGKIDLQKLGGPIGLRSTCAVSRIVTNMWDAKWLETMKTNNLKIRQSNRYMDNKSNADGVEDGLEMERWFTLLY